MTQTARHALHMALRPGITPTKAAALIDAAIAEDRDRHAAEQQEHLHDRIRHIDTLEAENARLRREAAEVRAAAYTESADTAENLAIHFHKQAQSGEEHGALEVASLLRAAARADTGRAAAARPDADFSEVIARCPEHGTRTETYAECRCPTTARPDNTGDRA